MRIGLGYDSHRFTSDRPLILGGVRIPDHPGLQGHSDGDAVAHAVTDAILGAANRGDIGVHFPPGDERWKGADSMELLARAVELAGEAGFHPSSVDVVVIAETVRIGPIREELQKSLARVLDLSPSHVSIKGKSNEGLGWVGRNEGLAVQAVALLQPRA